MVDDAGLLDVLEDLLHVDWLTEDLLCLTEVPPLDGLLSLDVSLGGIELVLPLLKDGLTLLDDLDGILWLLSEDSLDFNLSFDFVADLVGDGLQDIFKLVLGLIDVSRDGPDELKTSKKRWEGLLNDCELTSVDVLELAIKRAQELHEVLGLVV